MWLFKSPFRKLSRKLKNSRKSGSNKPNLSSAYRARYRAGITFAAGVQLCELDNYLCGWNLRDKHWRHKSPAASTPDIMLAFLLVF